MELPGGMWGKPKSSGLEMRENDVDQSEVGFPRCLSSLYCLIVIVSLLDHN